MTSREDTLPAGSSWTVETQLCFLGYRVYGGTGYLVRQNLLNRLFGFNVYGNPTGAHSNG